MATFRLVSLAVLMAGCTTVNSDSAHSMSSGTQQESAGTTAANATPDRAQARSFGGDGAAYRIESNTDRYTGLVTRSLKGAVQPRPGSGIRHAIFGIGDSDDGVAVMLHWYAPRFVCRSETGIETAYWLLDGKRSQFDAETTLDTNSAGFIETAIVWSQPLVALLANAKSAEVRVCGAEFALSAELLAGIQEFVRGGQPDADDASIPPPDLE